MKARTRRLILEICERCEPITGSLGDDRDTRTFSGWLELAAALQDALDAAEPNGVRTD